MSAPDDNTAHEVFLDFIEKELQVERLRKILIRRDAFTLAVFSGTVAALLTTMGIIDLHNRSWWAVAILAATVATHATSTIFGLLAARSTPSTVATIDTLDRIRDDHWDDDEAVARKAVAHIHTLTITALRKGNNTRSRLLDIGQITQLAAVISTLAAVIVWTWPR